MVTAHYVLGKHDAINYRPPVHKDTWNAKQKAEYERGYNSVN